MATPTLQLPQPAPPRLLPLASRPSLPASLPIAAHWARTPSRGLRHTLGVPQAHTRHFDHIPNLDEDTEGYVDTDAWGGQQAHDLPQHQQQLEVVEWDASLSNAVTLIGRVSWTDGLKETRVGPVFNFGLGVKNAKQGNQGLQLLGEDSDINWFTGTVFGDLAEVAAREVEKGVTLQVAGQVQVQNYTSKEGQPKTKAVVICKQVRRVRNMPGAGSAPRSSSSAWHQPPYEASGGAHQWEEQGAAPEWEVLQQQQFVSGGSGSASSSQYAATPSVKRPAEEVWDELFRFGSQRFFDNRKKKLSERSPDFKHKTTKEGLWLNSTKTPQWVKEKIHELDGFM